MGGHRLRDLDLLRGYAVALVLCLHLALTNPFRGIWTDAVLDNTEMGLGVDVFFVISGYVISRALAQLWDAESASPLRDFPLRFYRRRFIRLWPAAALWLVLCVPLAVIFNGHSLWPPIWPVVEKSLFGLVYLSNFREMQDPGALGYFWSLSVEWQFYLLFPLLLLFIRRDSWRIAFLAGALGLAILFRPDGPAWHFLRFDGLVFGILLYVLLDRLRVVVPRYRALEHWFYRPAITFILLAAIVVVPRGVPDIRIGYLIATALGAVLVGMAALDRNYVSTLGLGRFLRWLGSRSYSLYLVHMPMTLSVRSLCEIAQTDRVLRPANDPNLWYYGLSVAAIALAAELTYRLVERPNHRASTALAEADRAPATPRTPRAVGTI